MYTILINNDNTLTKSVVERIMHRSNMVDKIHFLVPQMYNEFDMKQFTVCLEYTSPISRKYRTEILIPQEELYKDRLEYVLPVDTKLTSEPGEVQIKFTFTMLDMLEDGTKVSRVRVTDTTTLTIIPIDNWSDQIAETDLGNLAEIMLAMQAQNEEMKALVEAIHNNKADSLELDEETGTLKLKNGDTVLSEISTDDLGDVMSETENDGLVKVII